MSRVKTKTVRVICKVADLMELCIPLEEAVKMVDGVFENSKVRLDTQDVLITAVDGRQWWLYTDMVKIIE